MGKPRRRRHRQQRDPWTAEPRDPLEMLARLGGRAAQPGGGGGSGGVPMADSDLTTALGYCPDKLGAALAMSVACRTGNLMQYVVRRAYRRVCRSIAETRDVPINMQSGADRFRIRVALVDATTALIWPEQRRPMAVAAKDAKMRHGDYSALYRHIEGRLEEYLANGRKEFRLRMWAEELGARLATIVRETPDTAIGAVILRTDVEPWKPVLWRMASTRAALVAEFRISGAMMKSAMFTVAASVIEGMEAFVPRARHTAEFDAGGVPLVLIVKAV